MHHANANWRRVVYERTRCRHSDTIGHRSAAAICADDDPNGYRYPNGHAHGDGDGGDVVTAASVCIAPV